MSCIPRKAPDNVVEQRHTLGQFERAQLARLIASQSRENNIQTFAQGFETLIKVGAACGVSWLAMQTYLLVKGGGDDDYINPTGSNLWANIRFRAGAINREQYDEITRRNNERARENAGKEPLGVLDWILFGDDGKFFGFDFSN